MVSGAQLTRLERSHSRLLITPDFGTIYAFTVTAQAVKMFGLSSYPSQQIFWWGAGEVQRCFSPKSSSSRLLRAVNSAGREVSGTLNLTVLATPGYLFETLPPQ
jgi:hypothetical protein